MDNRIPKRTIKFRFYHNPKSRPIITKCTINEPNGDTAMGIAICSDLDPFNGKIGKKIALGRAFKALRNKSNCSDILRPGVMARVYPWIDTHFKCMFVPSAY